MFEPGGPTFVELTVQAMSSTRVGYDLIAPKFDHTPFRTPDPVLEQVASVLGGRGPVERSLDVCCGTGAGMRMLRPLTTDQVVGLDFSPGMLAEAERRLVDAPGDASLRFVEGDALAMGFEQEFDLVTSFGAFGHVLVRDQERFLRGIHRALVPGGRFGFVTIRMPTRRSSLYWIYKGFNGVMRVRNALWRPAFEMYYLTFTVPEILPLFERVGFHVDLYEADWERRPYVIGVATRTGEGEGGSDA